MEKKKRQPTIKQKKAMALVMENGGNITQAMREAGYSESTVNNPSNLTRAKTWQELMDAYLPDDMILRALSDDIEKKEGNRTAELTLATKLKGRLTEKVDQTTNGKDMPTPILVQFLNEPESNTDTGGV